MEKVSENPLLFCRNLRANGAQVFWDSIAAKSFLLSEVPKGRSDEIAFSARIDRSDAVISLLPRFAARFRPFWVPPIKKILHARVNRIF